MERKKKKRAALAAAAFLVLAAAGLLALFLRGTDYAACVPKEAKAVVAVTPSAFADGDGAAALEKFFGGVRPQGLDLSHDVYLFVTPNEYLGLAAAATDGDAFARSVEKMAKAGLCTPAEKDGGRRWTWVKTGWIVAWDGHKVAVLGPAVAQERDALRRSLSLLMDGEGGGFCETDEFARMQRQTGSVRLYAALDALPAPYNLVFRLALPPACPLSAVRLFAGVQRDAQSGASVECETEFVTGLWARAFEKYEREQGCISFPAGNDKGEANAPLFRLVTRTSGGSLLRQLRSDATLRGLLLGLNQTIDADKMLSGADGLAELSVGRLAKDWTPSFCLRAENAGGGLFADASYWQSCAASQKDVRLERKGAEAFALNSAKGKLLFGRTGGHTLYFASQGMDSLALSGTLHAEKVPYRTGGVRASLRLDLAQLWQQPCMTGGAADLLRKLLPSGKAVTAEVLAGGKIKAKVE